TLFVIQQKILYIFFSLVSRSPPPGAGTPGRTFLSRRSRRVGVCPVAILIVFYCELAGTKPVANNWPVRVPNMWALYRNTFVRFQALIALITCAAFVATGYRLSAAAVFFAVMQLGAVLGAMWSQPARR